jgi:two-component system, cell cycle sensor histidine kinase and response regulator CckA
MGLASTSVSTAWHKDQPPTILVVEDETVIATDLERTLRRMGYRVLPPVASAQEALDAVRNHQPDLVLMDVRIQGECDGIEAAAQIRRSYSMPVVYLTAHGDTATLERAKLTGPLGFLLKPFRARDLHATVDMALYRHQVERRIAENERWLRTILNSIGDAVVVTDQDARVSMLNLRARELMRRTEQESLGEPIEKVMNLARIGDAESTVPSVRQAMSQAQAIQAPEEVVLLLSDGHRVVIDENASPLLEDGKVVGGVTAFRDVTERSALRRQAEFTNRLTAIGTLSAGFAHEVNNPLMVISGNLELVERWLDEAPANEAELSVEKTELDGAVKDIRTSVEKIASLVAELSGFGKPGPRGEQRGNVNKCIRWAVTSVRAAFTGKASVVVDAPELSYVRLDERRIGQVLINLLTNALQSLNPDTVARNLVTLRAFESEGESIVVEVSDTGSGIAPDIQKRLFDPFVTGKASTGGTGLGLFICHSIVAGAGGSLTFETAPGAGTVFRVVLPMAE